MIALAFVLCKFWFKIPIAIAQKLSGSGAYGDGHGYLVEVGFVAGAGFDPRAAGRVARAACAVIDHQALGVDLDLGFEPTGARLADFLAREIARRAPGAMVEVIMRRGDGVTYSRR